MRELFIFFSCLIQVGLARRERISPTQFSDLWAESHSKPSPDTLVVESNLFPVANPKSTRNLAKTLGMLLVSLSRAAAFNPVARGAHVLRPNAGFPRMLSGSRLGGRSSGVSMRDHQLDGVEVTPLVNGRVSGAPVSLSSLWQERGAVIFAVRRPGWQLCREEALDLCSALKGLDIPVVGVVKEEELPEPIEPKKMRGVAEFETKYFCGPLFLSDEAQKIYDFLGNKPIFTLGQIGRALLNPFKIRRELKEMGAKYKKKGIEGNLVGDGKIKGGILCMSPNGELKHVFYEDPGKGVPQEAQEKIVEAVRSFGNVS